ncbi:MAG TPA: energy transducer TonB [Blastocatellia bacterium]
MLIRISGKCGSTCWAVVLCGLFLASQTSAHQQAGPYDMLIQDSGDVPIKILHARIEPDRNDLKIDVQLENIGALTVDGFSLLLPDGARQFSYTVEPGTIELFRENIAAIDMKRAENMLALGQLSSWSVSVGDVHFAVAGDNSGLGQGLPIRLDISAAVEGGLAAEVSLPNYINYFLQESGEADRRFLGPNVLGFTRTHIEIRNPSKTVPYHIRYRIDGAVGGRWESVFEARSVTTIGPGEEALLPIEVPVEVLAGGSRRSFGALRLVVSGAADGDGRPVAEAVPGAGEGRARRCSGTLTLVQRTEASVDDPDKMPVLVRAGEVHDTEEARKDGIEGVVRVEALIGIDGAVKSVRIIKHLPDGLDEQAVVAAHGTEFKPALKGGQPVPCWQLIDVAFSLSSDGGEQR